MQDSQPQADYHSNNSLNFEQRVRDVLPASTRHFEPDCSGSRCFCVDWLYWNGYRVYTQRDSSHGLFRKEVIQPQVLLRLPCYDFTPIMSHTLGRCLPCGLACRLLVQSTFVM